MARGNKNNIIGTYKVAEIIEISTIFSSARSSCGNGLWVTLESMGRSSQIVYLLATCVWKLSFVEVGNYIIVIEQKITSTAKTISYNYLYTYRL